MRLSFPEGPKTMHQNILIICVGVMTIFAGSLSVYTRLVDACKREGFQPECLADAETWLQAIWLALLVSVSGIVYSFFALCR